MSVHVFIRFQACSYLKGAKKAPISFIHVRLSVRMKQLYEFSSYLIHGSFTKMVDTSQFWSKSDNNDKHFTLRPTCDSTRVGNPQSTAPPRGGTLFHDIITQEDRRQTPHPPQTTVTFANAKFWRISHNCYAMHTFPNFV
jgi:hypothetical protein